MKLEPGVREQIEAVICEYAGTDLLCYRATGPEKLAQREANAWDPILDWVEETLGIRFNVTQGILPCAQPEEARKTITNYLKTLTGVQLGACFEAVQMLGSFCLAYALMNARISVEEAVALAFLDECFQEEIWGADEDRAKKRAAISEALQKSTEIFHSAG